MGGDSHGKVYRAAPRASIAPQASPPPPVHLKNQHSKRDSPSSQQRLTTKNVAPLPTTHARATKQLKTGDPRHAITVSMTLAANGQPLEARHFGYGVLQHVVHERWHEFSPEERQHLAGTRPATPHRSLRSVAVSTTFPAMLSTPMTNQPFMINHPNIPMWIYFLTLFTRR